MRPPRLDRPYRTPEHPVATDEYEKPQLAHIACVHRVHGAVARVVLSFPSIGSLSEIADRAEVAKGLLIDAAKAVNQAMMSESDPFSDAETTRLIREFTTAREEFARAANLEIGKRRWPWKKYGQ